MLTVPFERKSIASSLKFWIGATTFVRRRLCSKIYLSDWKSWVLLDHRAYKSGPPREMFSRVF